MLNIKKNQLCSSVGVLLLLLFDFLYFMFFFKNKKYFFCSGLPHPTAPKGRLHRLNLQLVRTRRPIEWFQDKSTPHEKATVLIHHEKCRPDTKPAFNVKTVQTTKYFGDVRSIYIFNN